MVRKRRTPNNAGTCKKTKRCEEEMQEKRREREKSEDSKKKHGEKDQKKSGNTDIFFSHDQGPFTSGGVLTGNVAVLLLDSRSERQMFTHNDSMVLAEERCGLDNTYCFPCPANCFAIFVLTCLHTRVFIFLLQKTQLASNRNVDAQGAPFDC